MEITRKVWSQWEVVQIGKFLGFENFDRRAIHYWTEQGVMSPAIAKAEGVLALYDTDKLIAGFIGIGKRMRVSKIVQREDIEWAMDQTLKLNKSRDIGKLIEVLRQNGT
jgi:hypothetical protein